jgi:hypothetical protein
MSILLAALLKKIDNAQPMLRRPAKLKHLFYKIERIIVFHLRPGPEDEMGEKGG